MSAPTSKNNDATSLGLNARVERRDFLNSTLIASGSVLLGAMTPLQLLAKEDWTGYSGIGDYSRSNGNTYEVMTAGHQIRDHAFEHHPPEIIETGELHDCVVVGGGISGLSAALFFQRQAGPQKTCLVIDNHPIFGGEAKRNEFNVDGQHLMVHQGSAACFPPLPGTFLQEFYDSIGIDWSQFQYQTWNGSAPELPLSTTPYLEGGKTAGMYFGRKFGRPEGVWITDPWGKNLEGAPIPDKLRNELLSMKVADRKPFSAHQHQPKQHGDAASRYLDSITLEQHLSEAYGLSKETIRTFLSPISGGGSGLGPDVLCAYCEYAADVLLPWDYKQGAQMFPGGNAGVARHILKKLVPDAIPDRSICRQSVRPAWPSRHWIEKLSRRESAWSRRSSQSSTTVIPRNRSLCTYCIRKLESSTGCVPKPSLWRVVAGPLNMWFVTFRPLAVRRLSIPSRPMPDGKRGCAQLALSLQDGPHGMSMVRRFSGTTSPCESSQPSERNRRQSIRTRRLSSP